VYGHHQLTVLSNLFNISWGENLSNKKGDEKSFLLNYGSGGVKGTVARETVTLEHHHFKGVKIGFVNHEDKNIADFEMDAVFGLGFEGGS